MTKIWYLNLTPGHYQVLPDDVNNPDVDRRKTRDWRCAETFPAGIRIYARRAGYDDENSERSCCHLEKLGTRYHSSIGPGNDAYPVLVAALVPVTEDYEGWKHRVDLNEGAMEHLIDKLVATNLAPTAMLEAMLKIYRGGDV